MISPRERLIVALDVSSAAQAQTIIAALGDSIQFYKIGMQLYTAEGPNVVRDLVAQGKKVFLDLKYHDIPNTVSAAVREAAQLGVSMLTVHAAGGSKMLRAAVEAARISRSADVDVRVPPAAATCGPRVLAVTVLTSIDEQDLHETGVPDSPEDQVLRLASMALSAGCDGVVSSAHEVKALRARLGTEFLAVTPGVRPAGAYRADQARVVTPSEAILAGATNIVVGRPITAAPNPALEAEKILREIA